jgi:predicted Ser/Thr protein kinase
VRYKISKYIQFLRPEEYLDIQADEAVLQDRVLMRDDREDRSFLINSTIETFIKKFSVAKTCNEVTKEIATEVNAPVNKVNKVISSFFKHSKHRHFIVREDCIEKEINTDALFSIDKLLDQYKIERIIDTRRKVDIYLALDIESNNTVVIKLIKQPREKQIEELKREFNFLKILSKTGVTPAAYTFIEKAGYVYFTQEFVDGLALSHYIKKRGSTKKLVLTIATELIKAFGKIHAENIVHGDIHPSNIIFTNETKIKVIDFGFAIHQELEKNEVIQFGGVYFFMPPERIRKTSFKKFTRKPDYYSDVFQLGVVLYKFLYDTYPFNGITWEELATEIKEKQIEFPPKSQFGFLVPEWLKRIIKKCVAKRPSKRFANAQELYKALLKKQVVNASKVRPAVKI